MSNTMKKCPKCQADIEFIPGETLFCEYCGASLSDMEDVPTSSPEQKNDIPEQPTPVADASEAIADNDCRCLKVRYNKSTFLMTGKVATLKIELTPLRDDLKDVMIFMQHTDDNGNFEVQQWQIQQLLKKDRPFVVTRNYNPGSNAGLMTLNFYVGCRLDKEVNYYLFSATHCIYDPECSREEFKQVIINQNISATDAADINFYGGVLKNMEELSGKTANDMITSLGRLPETFVCQRLERIQYDPVLMEIIAESGEELYSSDKLLLKWNDCKLYLLAQKEITLGRTLNADLMVRKEGSPSTEKPNRTVSRVHALLSYFGDHVELKDQSSYGTYVNHYKLSNEAMQLPGEANIEFGDLCWKMNLQYCGNLSAHNMKMCKTCLRQKVKSLTFADTWGGKEFYLMVWQCCDLGMVIQELSGWNVFHRNGSFIIRAPDGRRKILSPGKKVEYDDQTIEIFSFKQTI